MGQGGQTPSRNLTKEKAQKHEKQLENLDSVKLFDTSWCDL